MVKLFKQMVSALILIISVLLKTTAQATKSVPNPYLSSLRTGTLLFPLSHSVSIHGNPIVDLTRPYSTSIENTTQLQCYSFLTSFQYIDLGSFSAGNNQSCNETHIVITLNRMQIYENLITYMVVFDSLVGSPNFMLVRNVSGRYNPTSNPSVKALERSLNTTGVVKFYSFIKGCQVTLDIYSPSNASKDYGYKLDIKDFNSTSLTYNISYIGASQSLEMYNYTFQFLVIIVNENYFNNQTTTIVSGSAKTFTNLSKRSFQNQMSGYSVSLSTLAGLSGFRYNRNYDGKPAVIFYFQQSPSGEISINTTIYQNQFYLNYLTFPNTIQIVTQDIITTGNSTNQTGNNSSNSNNTAGNQTSSKNNSNTDNQPYGSNNNNSVSESSSKIALIIAICVCPAAAISIIVVLDRCCRKAKQSISQPAKAAEVPIERNDIVITSSIPNQRLTKRQQICSVCRKGGVQVSAECFHSFHFQCFKTHLSVSSKCLECPKQLKSCKYDLFCANCKKRANLSFSAVKDLNLKMDQQTLCEDCLQTELQRIDLRMDMDYALRLNEGSIILEI